MRTIVTTYNADNVLSPKDGSQEAGTSQQFTEQPRPQKQAQKVLLENLHFKINIDL